MKKIPAYILNLIRNQGSSGGGGITPTGEIEITENGTYDVTNYASANVNVAGEEIEITFPTINLSQSSFSTFPNWLKNAKFVGRFNLSSNTNLLVMPTLNLANVTEVSDGMSYCSTLTTVENQNLSNCTKAGGFFKSCTSLTTVGNINLENATACNQLFENCRALTTIGIINIKSATGISGMFDGCTNLTNESLNNILASCLTNTSLPNRDKTLYRLGLSQTQATTCTTLSNWSACQSAGWTTGY